MADQIATLLSIVVKIISPQTCETEHLKNHGLQTDSHPYRATCDEQRGQEKIRQKQYFLYWTLLDPDRGLLQAHFARQPSIVEAVLIMALRSAQCHCFFNAKMRA